MNSNRRRKRGTLEDAKRLKALRAALGMTQRQLADEFLCSPGAIALWEQYDNFIPGPVLRLIDLYEEKMKGAKAAPRTRSKSS